MVLGMARERALRSVETWKPLRTFEVSKYQRGQRRASIFGTLAPSRLRQKQNAGNATVAPRPRYSLLDLQSNPSITSGVPWLKEYFLLGLPNEAMPARVFPSCSFINANPFLHLFSAG